MIKTSAANLMILQHILTCCKYTGLFFFFCYSIYVAMMYMCDYSIRILNMAAVIR